MNPRKTIETLQEVIKETELQLEKEIKILQSNCQHPKEQVLETPASHGIIVSRAPMRVCKVCGWAEEGYSFWKLDVDWKYSLPSVKWDDLLHNVLGRIHTQHSLYHFKYPDRKCDDLCR